MKSILSFVVIASLHFSSSAFACEQHETTKKQSPKAGDVSATVCADAANTHCASLQYTADVNSSDEGKFTVNLQTAGDIANFKLDLWMGMGGHGHGSAPVEITQTSANSFNVKNAWFVMPGMWSIRIDFDSAGQHQHLEIPVYVAE